MPSAAVLSPICVELLCVVLPIVKRERRPAARRSRRRKIAMPRTGADDESHPELLVVRDNLVEARMQIAKGMMGADAAQSRLVQR